MGSSLHSCRLPDRHQQVIKENDASPRYWTGSAWSTSTTNSWLSVDTIDDDKGQPAIWEYDTVLHSVVWQNNTPFAITARAVDKGGNV